MHGKVYSYSRFSAAKQAAGASLARQAEYAKKWAAENGMLLDDTLSMKDEGLSAYHQKHIRTGALGVFLEAVTGGKIPVGSVLIVEGLDRLSRAEPILAQAQLAQIVNAGITVVTASDGKQYSRETLKANPMDLVYSLLVMIRAHEESETKSKRVSDALRRKCEAWVAGTYRGKISCGGNPSWVRWGGSAYELIPEMADAIRAVILRFTEGFGAARIIKELHGRGVTFTGEGQAGNIHQLLGNHHLFIGNRHVTASGVPYVLEDYYPRLISDDEYARLQLALASRKLAPRRAVGKGEFPNLVTGMGLAFCGHCGNPLVAQNQTRTYTKGREYTYRRVRCTLCIKNRPAAGDIEWRSSCLAPALERALLDYCSDQFNLDALFSVGPSPDSSNIARVALLGKIAEMEGQQQAILDAALNSPGGLPQIIISRLHKIESDLQEARRRESLLAAEGLVQTTPENAATASAWAELRKEILDLDYDSRMKGRKLVSDTFSKVQIFFRGALPDSPSDVFDILLVSKSGVSRYLRVDKETGELRRGLNLNRDRSKARGNAIQPPVTDENLIPNIGLAASLGNSAAG